MSNIFEADDDEVLLSAERKLRGKLENWLMRGEPGSLLAPVP